MRRLILTAAGMLLCAACAKAPDQAAQTADPAAAERRAQWAKLGDLPDWSGVWEIDWRNERKSPPRPQMKLTPEYEKALAEYRKGQQRGENLQTDAANCVPPGLPGIMTQPYPIEFLWQPRKVVMLTESYMEYRHIYTDGTAHPEDPDPTFMGHSTGKWEGDTLVVDSVGFTTATRLAPGVPHSDQLRIVERIRRVSPEWMEIETTMTDPVVLAEPYTVTISYKHLDEPGVREYVCLENNHSGADEKGRPIMHLE